MLYFCAEKVLGCSNRVFSGKPSLPLVASEDRELVLGCMYRAANSLGASEDLESTLGWNVVSDPESPSKAPRCKETSLVGKPRSDGRGFDALVEGTGF